MNLRALKRLLFTCLITLSGIAAANPSTSEGEWYTEGGDGIVKLSIQADKTLKGVIIASRTPDAKDTENPDPAKRNDSVIGMTILQDLTYDKDGEWVGGTIYDPISGNTYKLQTKLAEPNVLELRGFIGISLIGRTSVWHRKLD